MFPLIYHQVESIWTLMNSKYKDIKIMQPLITSPTFIIQELYNRIIA